MVGFSAVSHVLPVALLLFILTSGCNSEHPSSQQSGAELPAAEVSVITAEKSSPVRQVEIMGTVQAAERASIASKISGNITEILVSPGSQVSSGDLLVSISAGEISAKLLQAKAQLEQATRNLSREQNLLKKNASTAETVKTLAEAKTIAEAAHKEARTMLSYTSIVAPFDGIITKKHANIGDLATPGMPLLQLESESQLQVITHIPESLILNVSLGDDLPLYIPAAQLSITGTIKEIAPSADPQSRTAPVKLTLPDSDRIRSGQFARVSLPGTSGTAIMLPTSVLHRVGQMEKVFVADKQTARLRLVKTGLFHEKSVEILSGIAPGDQVIISSEVKLRDGHPIIIR